MMTTIFKKDVEVTSNSNTNYVTIHFYYYKSESGKKGYYISIQPIYREEKMDLFILNLEDLVVINY